MSPRGICSLVGLLLTFLCQLAIVRAQETPVDVSLCDLKQHPESFDKKAIRVRGTLSVHFEDFTLGGENCQTNQGIWLAFGGDVPGLVASTANDNQRKSGVDITVEGVSYRIRKDEDFRRLYALIAARDGENPKYRVTATLEGRFFAGEKWERANPKTIYGGYGHLGCCSLFIITEVSGVESVPPANLYLRGTVAGPEGKPMQGITVIDDILGGTPPERQEVFTNAKGEFEFAISGQQLRVEDPRYRPVALTVEPGGEGIDLKLEEARLSDWHVPNCSEIDKAKRVGFSVLFAIPSVMDSSPFENEEAKSYFVFRRGKDPISAELIISTWKDLTLGGAVSFGFRRLQQRWIRDSTGKIVGIDSQGVDFQEGHWRSTSFLNHDNVGYSLGKAKPYKTLDQIIDSACIAKP